MDAFVRGLSRANRVLDRHFAGTRLEILKFGFYISFPIGFMWYFGTNLDRRFAVPDFWPRPEQTHRIPFEREDIKEEIDRLRERRLRLREERLAREAYEQEQAQKQLTSAGEAEAPKAS